jgi:hypothetical protein
VSDTHRPVTHPYARGWSDSAAERPIARWTDEERAAARGWTGAEWNAYWRGFWDRKPAEAPPPLWWILAAHVAGMVLLHPLHLAQRRRGRTPGLVALGVVGGVATFAIVQLGGWLGRRTARELGARRVDAPKVPRNMTPLATAVVFAIDLARQARARGGGTRPAPWFRLLAGSSLASALLEWWAWRPVLRRLRAERASGSAGPPA